MIMVDLSRRSRNGLGQTKTGHVGEDWMKMVGDTKGDRSK